MTKKGSIKVGVDDNNMHVVVDRDGGVLISPEPNVEGHILIGRRKRGSRTTYWHAPKKDQ